MNEFVKRPANRLTWEQRFEWESSVGARFDADGKETLIENEFLYSAQGSFDLADSAHSMARLHGPFAIVAKCSTCQRFIRVAILERQTLCSSLSGEPLPCLACKSDLCIGEILCFLGRIDMATGAIWGAGAMYGEPR